MFKRLLAISNPKTHLLRTINRSFASKQSIAQIQKDVQPRQTPHHPNLQKPFNVELDDSKYFDKYFPKSKNIVDECLLQPDEPYEFQEIQYFAKKIYQERKKTLKNQYIANCLPFDIKGQDKISAIKQKQYVEMYRNYNKISQKRLDSVLTNLFKQAKQAIIDCSNNDKDKYKKYFESRLAQKLHQNKLTERKMNISCEQTKDQNITIQSSQLIKGVFANRQKNGTNYDYLINFQNQDKGMVEYLHKQVEIIYIYFHDEFQLYTFNMIGTPNLRDFSTPIQRQNFLNKSGETVSSVYFLYGKSLHNSNVIINSLSKFKTQNNKVHAVVFENELRAPPSLVQADIDFQQWINYNRYFQRNWRISDIDFYMNGNQFYSQRVDIDKVEKLKPLVQDILPPDQIFNKQKQQIKNNNLKKEDRIIDEKSMFSKRVWTLPDFNRIMEAKNLSQLDEDEQKVREWADKFEQKQYSEGNWLYISQNRQKHGQLQIYPYIYHYVNKD